MCLDRSANKGPNSKLPCRLAFCVILALVSVTAVRGQQSKEIAPECPFLLQDVIDSAWAAVNSVLEGNSEEETDQLFADYEAALDTYKMGCTPEGSSSEERTSVIDAHLIIDRTNLLAKTRKGVAHGARLAADARELRAEINAYRQKHPPKRGRRIIEGAIVERNSAKLTDGYEFVRLSKNKVSLRRARTGVIHGEFTCICSSGDGSCALIISGNAAICLGETCQSCSISVVVKPDSLRNNRKSP